VAQSACSCDDDSDDNGDDDDDDDGGGGGGDDDDDYDDDDNNDNNGYAPINVKPEEGGSGNPQSFDFLITCIPMVGIFQLLQRAEEKLTIILTIIFCQGVGILIIF